MISVAFRRFAICYGCLSVADIGLVLLVYWYKELFRLFGLFLEVDLLNFIENLCIVTVTSLYE